jgi:hypothetical protein
MQNLANNIKVIPVEAAGSSAGTPLTSDAVDTQDWEGVAFVTGIGTADADNTVKLQQSNDSGGSPDDFTDIEGSAKAASGNGHVVINDINRPAKRYVRAVITRSGADTTTGTMYAILYNGRKVPNIGDDTDQVVLATPDEGTA